MTVTVNPSVAITSPANGATVNGDSVLVSGSFAGPANAGVTINGVVAVVDVNRNFHAVVPLAAGNNTLTAKLTTLVGQTATQSISVTSDGLAPAIQITADRLEGVAPLTVNFKLAGGTAPMQVQVQVTGTATITQPDDTTIAITYPSAGGYPTTITVTDAQGRTAVRNYVIVAHDAAQVDQNFKAMWADISTRLAAGDVEAALVFFAPESRTQYRTVLNNIAPALGSMFSNPPVIHPTNLSAPDYAEYLTIVLRDGTNYGYRFYFTRGTDGVWRLESL